MQELGCPEGDPDEEGNTCGEVCETAEASGFFSLNPACRAEQSSCEDMEENCND